MQFWHAKARLRLEKQRFGDDVRTRRVRRFVVHTKLWVTCE
jgi:hypothetical protein